MVHHCHFLTVTPEVIPSTYVMSYVFKLMLRFNATCNKHAMMLEIHR